LTSSTARQIQNYKISKFDQAKCVSKKWNPPANEAVFFLLILLQKNK